eukprot:gnl/Ergobibamus_cyprinoides/5932.p1 GENE.gnl/Ergobibamus_cyprinoides/5932~~gnl/Ergobibamus_cyprinoides/5932.p1  ORF type:complete len:133 (-),score=65.94 gnl/Ergobibamus_cyprinoides/5932:38-436(-)
MNRLFAEFMAQRGYPVANVFPPVTASMPMAYSPYDAMNYPMAPVMPAPAMTAEQALAIGDPTQRRLAIGNVLYPRVEAMLPSLNVPAENAPAVTGHLLEIPEDDESFKMMLESEDGLRAAVTNALQFFSGQH